jgi:CRP/FNR family transcriptional regulator, anaerobic regulatory protein
MLRLRRFYIYHFVCFRHNLTIPPGLSPLYRNFTSNKYRLATLDRLQKIKSAVNSVIPNSREDWKLIADCISVKVITKNNFLLEEGQICDFIAFVNQGEMIYFKPLENGNDVTTDFAFSGDWVTNNHSRINQSPSHLSIKAIEKTELCIIRQSDINMLYREIPLLERFGRVLIEQAYVRQVQLSIDLQTLSATERYQKLLKEHPDILQKIPLYHIANYLGIAPKSLSRIRNSMFGKG